MPRCAFQIGNDQKPPAFLYDGRDVGAAVAFRRTLDGERLSFAFDDDRDIFVDEQTDSTWTILGQAVSGPLEGKQLKPIAGLNNFWFSWAAFHPRTGNHHPDEKNADEGESGGNADVLHVRAHDLVDGYSGREVVVDLTKPSGPDYEIETAP